METFVLYINKTYDKQDKGTLLRFFDISGQEFFFQPKVMRGKWFEVNNFNHPVRDAP
jgi:hypothetical protein